MRPRERYSVYGPDGFSDEELLALIIGPGTARYSALDLARALTSKVGSPHLLALSPIDGLRAIPGIGLARAVRLHAALELGRRASRRPAIAPPQVVRPGDAWHLLRGRMEGLDVEELHGLYLNRRGQVLCIERLTRGSDAATVVDPRQVFRVAVQSAAASVIVAHNHPSGDPNPSERDRQVTLRLYAAGKTLGIALLDHLVLGMDCYTSMAELNILPAWNSA